MSLYTEAAKFLEVPSKKQGSLKSVVFAKISPSQKKNAGQILALVSSATRVKHILDHVIKKSEILKTEKKLSPAVGLLMIHDLLMTRSHRINCGKTATKEAVLRHKTRLKAELTKYLLKNNISDEDLKAMLQPENKDESPIRWIRTNLIKAKDEDIKAFLVKNLHLKPTPDFHHVFSDRNAVYFDIHVPCLYGLSPKVPIHKTELYTSGQIIIQDRASCFPATILNPKPGQHLIDACSAPGNKTTHLAGFIKNTKDSIQAFERDAARAKILKKMVTMAGANKSISINVQDFTDTDPNSYTDVVGVLVDPSCSGSGIFGRDDENDNVAGDQQQQDLFRLHKLAEFQYKIVKHALSFPSVQTVVYSTCSIHAEENEQVVKRLLQDPEVRAAGWTLRSRENVLPLWQRRGLVTEFADMGDESTAIKLADACVRALRKEDGGIGFFAACFERTGGDLSTETSTAIQYAQDVNTNDVKESDDSELSEYSEWSGLE